MQERQHYYSKMTQKPQSMLNPIKIDCQVIEIKQDNINEEKKTI